MSGYWVSYTQTHSPAMPTILLIIYCPVSIPKPLCSLLFLVRIVGKDEFYTSSKLSNVLRGDWFDSEPRTRLGSLLVNLLFWLRSE